MNVPPPESAVMDTAETGVLSFRMGSLEAAVKELAGQFNTFATSYPTLTHLSLVLDPMRADIAECKKEIDALKREKEAARFQKERDAATLKIALTVAALSPLVSAFFTYSLTK